jgi:hypothetical protein
MIKMERLNSFKALVNSRVVYNQNKHNNKNRMGYLGIELCEYYRFGLYKI